MKYFYLFCNHGYGESFQHEFLRFAKTNPGIQCTLVFSTPDNRRQSRFKPVRVVTNVLRRFISRFGSGNVLICGNVNADSFITSIPAGATGFVAGFNQIFGKACISRFRDFINFHPSILPFYRGAIPSYWVLKNGETLTGFTAHRIGEKIDDGPILHQQYVEIPVGIEEHGLDKLVGATACGYFRELLDALASDQPLKATRLDSPYRIPAGYMPPKRKE